MRKTTEIPSYQIRRSEDIEKLFPKDLTITFIRPYPNAKENLIKHVSNFITDQNTFDIKLQLLLKAASIGFENEEIIYWIINQAFKLIFSQATHITTAHLEFYNLLLDLTSTIPFSTFLWFYLEKAYNSSLTSDEWLKLFAAYNPNNFEQTQKNVNPIFVHNILSQRKLKTSQKLNEARIEFAQGNYYKAAELCRIIISSTQQRNPLAESSSQEKDEAIFLFGRCNEYLLKDNKFIEKIPPEKQFFASILDAYSNGNHKEVIRLCEKFISLRKRDEKNSTQEDDTVYSMLGKSYEQDGDKRKALEIYEIVYPRLVKRVGINDPMRKMVKTSLESLKAEAEKNKTNNNTNNNTNSPKSPQTDLYDKSNPMSLYKSGMADYKKAEENKKNNKTEDNKKLYETAIGSLTKALSLFIEKNGKKNENSITCVNCYSSLASVYRDSGEIEKARKHCAKAYGIACIVYEENSSDQLDILKKLRSIEVHIAEQQHGKNSIEYANANYNLAIVYEKLDDVANACQTYMTNYEIKSKLLGEDHNETQEAFAALDGLRLKLGK